MVFVMNSVFIDVLETTEQMTTGAEGGTTTFTAEDVIATLVEVLGGHFLPLTVGTRTEFRVEALVIEELETLLKTTEVMTPILFRLLWTGCSSLT